MKNYLELLYFSFVTWSTLGFGDLTPRGAGRVIVAVEVFSSATISTVLLSIVFIRALEPRIPIVFPEKLVYDVENFRFWFRFVNIDPENLRDVSVKLYLLQFLDELEEEQRKTYDTITSEVSLPFHHYPYRESLNLTALHTVSDMGHGHPDHPGNFEPVVLCPLHIVTRAINKKAGSTLLDLEISGFFEATGGRFFVTKTYRLEQIVCGKYENVNNYTTILKRNRDLEKFIDSKLSLIRPTPLNICVKCIYFRKGCQLEVARQAMKTVDINGVANDFDP